MTMVAKNQGKPENRKRKMSDADQESEEEEDVTVAAKKTVAKKNKPKKAEKIQSESQVADEDNDEDTEENTSTEQSKSGSGSLTGTSKDDDRRDERDRRTLFLKNLPGNCTVRHIKALSKDIKQVRLRSTFSMVDNRRKRISYAYVSFASEEAAEKNYKLLDGIVFKGTKVSVDYVGSKSQFQTARVKTEPEKMDPLRLYVSGLPGNATEDDILKLFPGAVEIVLPKRNKDKLLFGYGFVGFNDPTLTSKYHDQGQDLVLHGKKLVVLYAKMRPGGSGKGSEKKKQKQKQKGTKAAAKQEVDMEDDDDEDDEDDEDEDDE